MEEFNGHAILHKNLIAWLQVTSHSHLLSHKELESIKNTLDISISSFFLSEFDTELDFKNEVG